jgi:hypothetical protein
VVLLSHFVSLPSGSCATAALALLTHVPLLLVVPTLQECKVPDRKELQDVVQAGIVIVTARVLGIPPGPLVTPDRLARQRQERLDAVQRLKHFDDHGNELSPRLTESPSNIDFDDVFWHSVGVRLLALRVGVAAHHTTPHHTTPHHTTPHHTTPHHTTPHHTTPHHTTPHHTTLHHTACVCVVRVVLCSWCGCMLLRRSSLQCLVGDGCCVAHDAPTDVCCVVCEGADP